MKQVGRTKKSPKKSSPRQESELEVINPHTAGIDVGSREHWVCVPRAATESPVRCFGHGLKKADFR